MISRIATIKGIGRFRDCNFSKRDFGKHTIIFGRNTAGKSTLTDIFWSLKTGDKKIIEGRRTFGFSDDQEVELINDSGTSTKFSGPEWEEENDTIGIFDNKFVNENIFQGSEITYEQQKNLHGIIIGPEGKTLADEIAVIQKEMAELTSQKTAKTAEFNRFFKKEITTKDFARLPSFPNVDDSIKEIQVILDNAKNQGKVIEVLDSSIALVDNVINQNTKSILSKSIQSQQQLVADHILKTWKNTNHTKDFLLTGLNLTKEEQQHCVFCGHLLEESAKSLLLAYGEMFSNEYRLLQQEISATRAKFEKFNPIDTIERLKERLSSIKLSLDIEEFVIETIREFKTSIDEEFLKKQSDLNYAIDFDQYDSIIDHFMDIKSQIQELRKVNVYESEVNTENLIEKIREFELSKLRHSAEWKEFLKEYDDIDTIQEEKKKRREKLRTKLNTYSDKLFREQLDTINNILRELGADYEICDFQPIKNIVGQSERVFALKFFDNHKVTIDESLTEKPAFKNTLSDSDKRLLAFAFFYSTLLHDPNLSEKIIVFDDPFSSFDSERRLKAIQLLSNSKKQSVGQLIVLTHEEVFYKWLFEKFPEPAALKIIPDGDVNGVKRSEIVDYNAGEEFSI